MFSANLPSAVCDFSDRNGGLGYWLSPGESAPDGDFRLYAAERKLITGALSIVSRSVGSKCPQCVGVIV